MNEKFSQFFKGKMSKSVYVSVVSAVLCGAVAVTSTVVVHNKNKKIDSILNNTVSSGSTTESVTESTLSDESSTLQNTLSATNNISSKDKAMQYLKEYEKLTAEYEKKRAELNEQIVYSLYTIAKPPRSNSSNKPQMPEKAHGGIETDEQYASRVAQYELNLKKWEEESRAYDIEVSNYKEKQLEIDKKAKQESEKNAQLEKQIEQLDKKYKQDVENLKRQYGIK